MIDSTTVETAKEGINLAVAAYFAVTAFVGFIVGKFAKFKKKR